MTPARATASSPRSRLTESLGLTEQLFASSDERAMVDRIDAALGAVEAGLQHQLAFADELADTTARYLLDAGGKRVRPALTLLVAQLGQGAVPSVVRAAQAVELTHLATLYHDDVMDDAPLRRGTPTVQKVWGNSVAILTGDLLFARASRIVADLGEEAIKLQAGTFERLVLGQLHETTGPRSDEDPVAHYLQVLADKTGSLIALATRMGRVFSRAPAEYEQPLVDFGERIGVAFQLIDDVIDLSPRPAETGKRAGTDLLSGVATYPVLLLRQRAATDSIAGDLSARLDQDVTDSALRPDLDAAIAQLRDHEVTAETRAEAHRWSARAIEALEAIPAGPVRKALTRFAQNVVEREA